MAHDRSHTGGANRRGDYGYLLEIPTRWADNDVYGHVNNVEYFAFFDTAINRYLIDEGGLDIARGEEIGLCVESHCSYAASVVFPAPVEVGMRVGRLGSSSVTYEIAIFTPGREDPIATGWFVHVFVGRSSRRPTPIPYGVRTALERLVAVG